MAALVMLSVVMWSWMRVAPAPQSEPVVVEVFLDWQCPACAHMEYAPVVAKNAGAVKYVLRDYPLNHRCNPHVTSETHGAACEAAVAMRIARDRGKSEELAGWLFSNQPALTPAIVKAKAESLLGVGDFDAEYTKRLPDVMKDVEEGAARHLQFTPSVFLNGKLVNDTNGNWPPPERLDRMIQEMRGRR